MTILHTKKGQERKIMHALVRKKGVNIYFNEKGVRGNYVLTEEQEKIPRIGVFSIKFTPEELERNVTCEGSFLSLLLKILGPSESGGMVFARNGKKYHVTTSGNDVYLRSYRGHVPGDGLYRLDRGRKIPCKTKNKIINELL